MSHFATLIEMLVESSIEVGFARASNDVDKVLAAAKASWDAKQALEAAINTATKQPDGNNPQAMALHKDNFILVDKFGIRKGRLESGAAHAVIGGLAKFVGLSTDNKLALGVLRRQCKGQGQPGALWLKLVELAEADGKTKQDLIEEGRKLAAPFIRG